MQVEIQSAADFLIHMVRKRPQQHPPGPMVPEKTLQIFRNILVEILRHRYRGHWFPDLPNKGSAFRCIRINAKKMDPLIAEAGIACGFSVTFLHELFPQELTMWIDPKEVAYRIGENGSVCVLYESNEYNNSLSLESNSCKESLRSLEMRLDSREQLAPYVSS